ncbi:MAG TPA: prolyl oligopeptidase family serine peptidase [Polyangiaceae bacterium]|nr:prolyl oligopeptidase family serine peptidase [Polyangiaceae bacterium]
MNPPGLSTLARAALALILVVHCGGPDAAAPPAPPAPPARPAPAPPAPPGPPAAARRPVTDTYHGRAVVDEYRWLEDGKAAEVRQWSEAQNAFARQELAKLPGRAAIAERASAILRHATSDHFALASRKGVLFAMKAQPPKQQPLLVTRSSPDDPSSERVLLDPAQIDPSGRTTVDWFVPSRDGKLVAVSLSSGGTESGTVHVYEVATGRERAGDAVPRAQGGTAGGSLAWDAEGTGFWYTRYPAPGERPEADLAFYQQVYFHKLGDDPKGDAYAIGKEFPKIAETRLEASEDGRRVLATVAKGDGGEHALYLLTAGKGWSQLASYEDKVRGGRFGADGSLYLLSHQGAPRGKLLRLPPGATALAQAKVVLAEGEHVIDRFVVGQTRLYASFLAGGPSILRSFDLGGRSPREVALLPVASVGQLAGLGGDGLLVRQQSRLEPPAWYALDAKSGALRKTALARTSPVDFGDAEVVQETCASKDGTKVPMTVLRKKGAPLDGDRVALLTAYGGYGISQVPSFSPMNRLWLDRGGVVAVAGLRGGGEYGEAWHEAGKLTSKQNVFDDFEACARRLVEARYTRPARLGIVGGSNGGLLMGAALTQHPELYGAVVAMVGIFDMLRVETTPNGEFNVTEYGTVKDPDQFAALAAYSPYHRVRDGAHYPPTLFTTGANDPRVDPFHSRKMVARLAAADPGGGPFLLRTSGNTGHGMGTPLSDLVELQADVYAFLFHHLGSAAPAR